MGDYGFQIQAKMMAVHAYRAVEHWAREKGHDPVFSYLDARSLELVVDPPEPFAGSRRFFVGRKVSIALQDFLALHGGKLDEKCALREAILPRTACTLATFSSRIKGFTWVWHKWMEEKKKEKLLTMNEEELGKLLENMSDHEKEGIKAAQKASLQTLCEELGQPLGFVEVGKNYFEAPGQSLIDWLTGKWLENYVLYALSNLREKGVLDEALQKIEISGNIRFEVDVVAIRGYQLFAFSCKARGDEGRGSKADFKRDLFEVYVRARQLGGEEARAALVCASEDPAAIEKEMGEEFGLKEKVKVFGRRHLENLQEYLEKWLIEQGGEG